MTGLTFTYDNQADVLDISVSPGIVARTEEIDSGTLIDFDAQGAIVSIELIRPARKWPLDDLADRLDPGAYETLKAIWGENAQYPFTSSSQLVPA